MLSVAVRREASCQIEACGTAGYYKENGRCENRAQNLHDDVRDHVRAGETAAGPESDRNRRVDMASGYVPDRVGHREQRQSERERDTGEADAKVREARREHRA